MILRRWVTEISFLCDPHYPSHPKGVGPRQRSVRLASRLVMVDNSETIGPVFPGD
jgi:hypothetical protein